MRHSPRHDYKWHINWVTLPTITMTKCLLLLTLVLYNFGFGFVCLFLDRTKWVDRSRLDPKFWICHTEIDTWGLVIRCGSGNWIPTRIRCFSVCLKFSYFSYFFNRVNLRSKRKSYSVSKKTGGNSFNPLNIDDSKI